MTELFLDVLCDGLTQPLLFLGNASTDCHEQGHRVFDVMVGLGEECHVVVQRDITAHASMNNG